MARSKSRLLHGAATGATAWCRDLASNGDLLYEVLDSLPQGVLMFDPQGRLLYTNRSYLEMYGFRPDEITLGMPIQDMYRLRSPGGVLSDEAAAYCADLIETMGRGEVVSGNYRHPDGRTTHFINSPLPSGGWVVTREDISRQRRAEQRIEHMAGHDALTDLPNRTAFMAHLERALEKNPPGRLLAVMFLDLDNFKGVNDTLGHQVGDELLKGVADRMRECVRSRDMVARFGGDEFVVAASYLEDPTEAAALADRIREAILAPFDLLDHQVVVDVSIGVTLSPNDGIAADELIKNADLALYSAKGSGRGTYRLFEAEMDIRMMQRRNLELDLRAGFVNGEFEIFYQPLLNLETETVSGCEALLRWRHPIRGSVPPTIFIPVAEEIGLITRLGEWVIRNACAEAATWPGDVRVAVNVSPAQFHGQNLVQIVAHALAASGLAPHRLEIEITEAILLDHTDETLNALRSLHDLGVRIAMDDFGTGYSSLNYLQKFPFDKIKIDQAFIGDLRDDGESNAIVRAVTGIADSFRMATTAEGVETERQREIISALGCTEMQGHLFSDALSAGDIARLLHGQLGKAAAA